jgi:ribosome-interacting GTPase 1
LDALAPLTHKKIIERELEGFGIRLNKRPPEILIKRREKGGISIMKGNNIELTKISEDLIKNICHEYRLSNAELFFRCNATVEDLIDVLEGNRVYVPCIYVLNKIDQISIQELDLFDKVPHYVPISAKDEWNFDELMEKIWEYLDLIRIYTKPKGQIPDYDAPVIIPRGFSTIEGFCLKLHKSLVKELKYAWVWGTSVKHNP